MERKRILFDEDARGPEWVVVYHLGYSEFDDDPDDTDFVEIVLNATSIDIAVRYAQQYLKKMQVEEATAEEWANAQILSVELH